MSRNVFFSPSKANNFYSPTNKRELKNPDPKPSPFTDLRPKIQSSPESLNKNQPFGEIKKSLYSESSLTSLAKPQIKESSSQNPKVGMYKAAEMQFSKKSPLISSKLQPITEDMYRKLETKSMNSYGYFDNKVKRNGQSDPYPESTMIDGLYSNQANHLNKIKKLEQIQEKRQKVFEDSVFNSAKAKEDQLNSLIEKRIQEKNQLEERNEAEKKIKVLQQKKELRTCIEDQMTENPKKGEPKDSELWQRVKMIEEMRKKQPKVQEKIEVNGELQQNAIKFFGCEEENELPGSSTLKYNDDSSKLSPLRYGKTTVRNTTYNPITDSVNTYENNRGNPRGLGAKKVDDLPSKVNEFSPPRNTEYFTNRTKGYEITNPLTGEVKKVQKMVVNGIDDSSKLRFVIK